MSGSARIKRDMPQRESFGLDPYDLKPANNLSRQQQGAVNQYASNSTYLNGDSLEAEGLRRHLDAAIEKSRLSDDARLYRGFGIAAEHAEAMKAGDILPLSSGHVSTSTSKDVARRFSDDVYPGEASVLAEIRAPRGHPALHIPTDPLVAAELGGDQHEVLLPRTTRFHVHSVNEKSDGRYEVHGEALP